VNTPIYKAVTDDRDLTSVQSLAAGLAYS
jgi:hypothetical protein